MTTANPEVQARCVHNGPDVSVFEAVSLMAQKNIGALLVVEGDQVVGIVSERDYARKVVLMARSSRETPLRDIMSSPVMFVQPGQTSEECMALMTRTGCATCR
jgi:CBS domain-containing protein